MPTMSQNKRREKESIIEWILTLEQKQKLLEGRFERYRRTVEGLVLSFIQENGLDVDESPTAWRKKASRSAIERLRVEIDFILEGSLSGIGRDEAEKVVIPKRANYADVIGVMVTLETIRLMSDVETFIQGVLEDTVTKEFAKQGSMIGLEKQYFVNQLPDVMKAITQDDWSERIWGMYQTELRNQVNQLVRESLLRGYNPKKIAFELRKTIDRGRYNAERLMRTEQARVQGQSQIEAYKAQNITLFDLIVEPDGCKHCHEVAARGPYLVEEAVIGVNVEPIHPNCRCSTVGVLE